jgi:hypothetical protein
MLLDYKLTKLEIDSNNQLLHNIIFDLIHPFFIQTNGEKIKVELHSADNLYIYFYIQNKSDPIKKINVYDLYLVCNITKQNTYYCVQLLYENDNYIDSIMKFIT